MGKIEDRTPGEKSAMIALLGVRRFAPLFVTQFLGAFNDNVLKSALTIFITFNVVESIRAQSASLVTTRYCRSILRPGS